jgi:hypothetical protein
MAVAADPPTLTPQLTDWLRHVAAGQDPRVGAATPVVPLRTRGLPTRPFAPGIAQVFICAGVVVKLHAVHTAARLLEARLAAVREPDLEPVWVQPLGYRPLTAPDGRLATLWPRVTVLSTVDRPPWGEAGALLARLHRAALPSATVPGRPAEPPPPLHGGHDRLQRALAWLRGRDELAWLLADGEALAARLRGAPTGAWVHGDFHLGQLGHTLLRRSWKLLDVDDLGVGDPAWDLARPAGFWAAGMVPDEAWETFLAAYRGAGGTAVADSGDPWPALDQPARAAVLVAAVQALRMPAAADSAATAEALLDACRRMHHG